MPSNPLGIVVGVDGSQHSMTAVDWAARDAEMRNAPLKVVYVMAALPAPVADFSELQADHARQIIEEAHKGALEVTAEGRTSQVTSEVLHGPVLPTLIELSKEADMVVVGCRGQGAVARALLGSVSSGLVQRAHCPVAIIHDEDSASTRSPQAPVLVGIDGSPASELATEIAFDEASRRGVGLVALHAWSDLGPLEFGKMSWAPVEWSNTREREEALLGERLSGYCERYPDVEVHKIIVHDQPASRLLEHAENAQLVVVGSRGRGGFPGMLLGSVSRAVVNAARIPVIVARQLVEA